MRDAGDGADDVGRFVHHDHGGGAKARSQRAQGVEIHVRIHDLLSRHAGHGGATGDDREQVVPTATDAAAMRVDKLTEGDAHRFLDVAGRVHMPGNAE